MTPGTGEPPAAGSFGRELWPTDLLYTGVGAALDDGAVVAQRRPDGTRTVVAADRRERLEARFGDVVSRARVPILAPPPINAHTHLDLSDMPFTPGTYLGFIRAVIAHGRAGARGVAAARRGLAELAAAGTTTVGDVVASREVMRLLLEQEVVGGVAYWEVLEPDPARAADVLVATERDLATFLAWQRPGGMRVGLAPHTPHTVSAPLLQGLAGLARRLAVPMQIHVAEHEGEIDLHRHGAGALRQALADLVPDWRPSGHSPVRYLRELGVLEARPTLVHLVHVGDDDVRAVAAAGCTVVHCPRSNEALACGTFPWPLFARHGVTVALGTDSRGSSPDLDVRNELAAARRLHGARANPAQLLWSAVKGGARALGSSPPMVRRGDALDALLSWSRPVH